MTDDAVTDNQQQIVEDNYQETDIFLWANNLVQYLEEMKIDLYFFNKKYTVYSAKLQADVSRQLQPLFVDDILEYVFDGIEKGLIVRGFEEAESEDNVLQRTRAKNVDGLVEIIQHINSGMFEPFVEQDHDLKRMKGVVAYCHHPDMPSFYVIKGISASNIIKGDTAWLLKDGAFQPFRELAGLKLAADNQLLAIGDDLFVFKQSKLKQLFGYDAKANSIAAKKAKEIEAHFKLSFAEGSNMQVLLKGKNTIIKKLQKIEPGVVKQEELLEHAEEMGVDLMTDDAGSIIIMDDNDMTKFVNLLNEDYITSPITGERYEIIKKKPLKLRESKDTDEGGVL